MGGFITFIFSLFSPLEDGDDLGLQIQMSLVHESLMPDSRDDLLWLSTKLDKIPNRLKHSLGDIALEKPVIPQTFHTPLKNLLDHSLRAVQALAQAMDSLFSDLRAVRQYAEEVVEKLGRGRYGSILDSTLLLR